LTKHDIETILKKEEFDTESFEKIISTLDQRIKHRDDVSKVYKFTQLLTSKLYDKDIDLVEKLYDKVMEIDSQI